MGSITRNTLISTVGTSLFQGNLQGLSGGNDNAPANWQAIKGAYESKRWSVLARELLKCDPGSRICGAEINSVHELLKTGALDLQRIFFLVSDTAAGVETGRLLQEYFTRRRDLGLQSVKAVRVPGLQDQRPSKFKSDGLRNLVRKIGEAIEQSGGRRYVSINATGGYKAQIAVAVIMGQALDIPVFYKHEYFNEIISFPPLPVSFDYSVLGRNADLLHRFEQGEVLSSSQIGEIDPKMEVFLTKVKVDNEILWALGPVGQIYLTSHRITRARQPEPAPASKRREPTFGKDHHLPPGFKEFVCKVWRENNWIESGYSLPYSGQRAIKGIGFSVQDLGDKTRGLVGTYKTKDFGARFRVRLTDKSPEALIWAADYLNRKYGDKKI